jgi:hypothetical protein
MGMNFSALNQYARREYKFAQSDSFEKINPDVMGSNYSESLAKGVCMGAVLNWVKEKMTTSNGILNENGPLLNPTTKRFANPLNPVSRISQGISPPAGSPLASLIDKGKSGPRNADTMLAAAMTQNAYSGRPVSTVARELGLVEADSEDDIHIAQEPAPGGGVNRLDDKTIAEAGENLRKGRAVIIEVECKQGKHAIAFYRSRGGSLYFFDPNAGVYTLDTPYKEYGDGFVVDATLHAFVKAWLDAYVKQRNFEFKTPQRNLYYVFKRSTA